MEWYCGLNAFIGSERIGNQDKRDKNKNELFQKMYFHKADFLIPPAKVFFEG